jgi:hypothetical protein
MTPETERKTIQALMCRWLRRPRWLLAAVAAAGAAQLLRLPFALQNQSLDRTGDSWSIQPSHVGVGPPVGHAKSTIFFNVFIPDARNTRGVKRSFSIVSEQLQQIAESYAGGYYQKGNNSLGDALLPTVHIYYLTVGPADLLPEPRMNNSTEFCGAYPHFQCHHLGHHKSGFEDLTLEHLRGYCLAHPSERVVYLHNKGSFHSYPFNNRWRRVLTLGALAKDCVAPPVDRCDVCGFMWYTVFSVIVPGNMFAAKCDYVAKLPPLVEFPAKHRAAVGEGLLLIARGQLLVNVFSDGISEYGLERYFAEHWIGTLHICWA